MIVPILSAAAVLLSVPFAFGKSLTIGGKAKTQSIVKFQPKATHKLNNLRKSKVAGKKSFKIARRITKKSKTQELSFEPDYIDANGTQRQSGTKPKVIRMAAKPEVEHKPAKFKVLYDAPKSQAINDERLMNCIERQRVRKEYVRVFATNEEAQKNCKIANDGHIEEKIYANTCIHYEYGGANSFQNCYYGDPPDRSHNVRTWASGAYR